MRGESNQNPRSYPNKQIPLYLYWQHLVLITMFPRNMKTGDNGNAMLPTKVRLSKIPAKIFLRRSL